MAGFPYEYEGRTPVNSFNVDLATPSYYEWPINALLIPNFREYRKNYLEVRLLNQRRRTFSGSQDALSALSLPTTQR